jgi:hypothetical protein
MITVPNTSYVYTYCYVHNVHSMFVFLFNSFFVSILRVCRARAPSTPVARYYRPTTKDVFLPESAFLGSGYLKRISQASSLSAFRHILAPVVMQTFVAFRVRSKVKFAAPLRFQPLFHRDRANEEISYSAMA